VVEGDNVSVKTVLLWDRKAEGGFPETKVLKQRLRNHIDPDRDLGHSDSHGKGAVKDEAEVGQAVPVSTAVSQVPGGSTECEDCKT